MQLTPVVFPNGQIREMDVITSCKYLSMNGATPTHRRIEWYETPSAFRFVEAPFPGTTTYLAYVPVDMSDDVAVNHLVRWLHRNDTLPNSPAWIDEDPELTLANIASLLAEIKPKKVYVWDGMEIPKEFPTMPIDPLPLSWYAYPYPKGINPNVNKLENQPVIVISPCRKSVTRMRTEHRNVYLRKDGTAYVRFGNEHVDATRDNPHVPYRVLR